ncbi:MAG: hypothetical protein K2Q25_14435 [Mycobacteriaceae bacterium]|nr:hypothetical protein [Mycobacteriaceae bacterium]
MSSRVAIAGIGAAELAAGAIFFTAISPLVLGLADCFIEANPAGTARELDVVADFLQIIQFPTGIVGITNGGFGQSENNSINDANFKMCFIIALGMLAIFLLERLDHYGNSAENSSQNEPCSGHAFRGGADKFEEIRVNLTTAKPAGEWSGSAADDLTTEVAAHQNRTALVQQADLLLADTTDTQARQVAWNRKMIAGARLTLAAAIPTAMAIHRLSPVASLTWQIACTVGAVTEVVLAYTKSVDAGKHTATNAHRATAIYQQICESAAAQTFTELPTANSCDMSTMPSNTAEPSKSTDSAGTSGNNHLLAQQLLGQATGRYRHAPTHLNPTKPTIRSTQQPTVTGQTPNPAHDTAAEGIDDSTAIWPQPGNAAPEQTPGNWENARSESWSSLWRTPDPAPPTPVAAN